MRGDSHRGHGPIGRVRVGHLDVLVDVSVLHDQQQLVLVLNHLNVLARIRVPQQEVRVGALGDDPQGAVAIGVAGRAGHRQNLARVARAMLEGLAGRESEELRLDRNVLLEVRPLLGEHVGSARDEDIVLPGPSDHAEGALVDRPGLADLLRRVPGDPLRMGEAHPGHVALQGQDDVLSRHALHGLFGDEEGVLDDLYASVDRPIHGIITVGVRRDVGLVVSGDLAGGAQLGLRLVDHLERVVLRRDAAAGHDLQEGRALAEVPAALLDDLLRAVTDRGVGHQNGLVGALVLVPAADVEVPAGRRDRRPRGVDPRARQPTHPHGLGQAEGVAGDVPHRGHPLHQHVRVHILGGYCAASREVDAVGRGEEAVRPAEHQMLVHVDQPGGQHTPPALDDHHTRLHA
mmetsp:Transcript_122350/g.380917  ORF Transcript_122350/g.380917 Transcript_122350/m.380917 type:complete len:403 (+) Transcript_122350:243-1451(+)